MLEKEISSLVGEVWMLNYKLVWLVEGRVLHLELAGEYDLETTRQVIPALKKMVDEGTAPVHVVWDMRGITKIPKDIRGPIDEMSVLRYHPNGGWITMITNNVMLRFAGQIATRFLGANFRAVATFDDAIETICRVDPGVAEALKQAVPSSHA